MSVTIYHHSVNLVEFFTVAVVHDYRGLGLIRTSELDGIEMNFAMITGGPSFDFCKNPKHT